MTQAIAPPRTRTFRIRAQGPYACFTRPELRTERVSYEVMTPTAARGLLEAILWKPAIRWQIERITVLNPFQFEQLKRNEVNSRLSERGDFEHYYADDDRAQRNTVLLKNVDYIIEAHMALTRQAGPSDNLKKFEEMFARRLEKGQCFHTPYLGCREFAANVSPAPEQLEPHPSLKGEWSLGQMLHDLDYTPPAQSKAACQASFFEAILRDGVLHIPEVSR